MAIPKDAPYVDKVRKTLTLNVQDMDGNTNTYAFFEERDGYLLTPRQYGLPLIESRRYDTDAPHYMGIHMPDGANVSLHDYQKPWVEDLLNSLQTYGDTVAMAGTGKGKTVMALYAAYELGVTTLILVDQEFLRDQWIERLVSLFGEDRENIGLIQGKVCDVEGKSFVIGMVQTLYRKPFDYFLCQYFGTVIYDECHTVAAPQFSKVLYKFNPAYRIAVSATPDRRDVFRKVLDWHLGPVRVRLRDSHSKSKVYYIETPATFSWYGNTSPKTGRFLSEVSEDSSRNLVLATAIKWLYSSGRDVLALSDRIEHLENLMSLCSYLGIPEEDMGVVGGYYLHWGYERDPSPPRRPFGYERGTEYTPVRMGLIEKRTPKRILNEIKETRKVIFATYGMFNKGVDVPRLSSGVECTPRSSITQAQGRILRKHEGKLVPIWVSLVDTNSYRSMHMFEQRIGGYLESNSEIYRWQPDKQQVVKQDPLKTQREARARKLALKHEKILTEDDGYFTVKMTSTERKPSSKQGSRTGRTHQGK